MNAPSDCWIDGRLCPAAEARISPFDHGLLYGDGVFEGIRFYGGRPFALDAHLKRLERSARALALIVPYRREELVAAVTALVAAAGLEDGYLRLVVTRGAGALGIDPASCPRPTVFILAAPLALVDPQARAAGIRAIIASTRRLPLDGLDPRVKSLNYLNHVLARLEASRAGAQEALLLNGQGRVTEGTTENLFIVRDGALLTPPAIDGALDGITRALVLELAGALGIPAREASLAPYDLYTAEECFLTGTGAELIPVREIDARPLPACPGPVFRRLAQAFQQRVRGAPERFSE